MFESTDRFHLAVMNPSPSESIGSSATSSARCPRCRRVFDCGARGGREACWCVSMPAMPTDALDASTGCLCPECLADAIARTRAMEGRAAPAPD
ncbi:cysteine-rich CWC family protein [Paraburkholderia terrae]|uniref:cysteine-rich CWC family protein n=1 Tax=Paraburkholderia terrae TaxID=311230 RepID=UPI0037C557DE